MLNPVIMGILLRQGLALLAGVLTAHTGYQVSQPEVDTVAAAVEGTVAGLSAIGSVALSVKNKRKLGAL